MIDVREQERWFQCYVEEADKVAPSRVSRASIRRWARSMSLIAEQHADIDDSDDTELEAVD